MKMLLTLTLPLTLILSGCSGMQSEQLGGLVCVNCKAENKGKVTILAPISGSCDDIKSKLNVDDAANKIKRKFNFMTTDEMKASPNGSLILSSTDYGWSAVSGSHYMMKQFINQGRGGFIQAEVSKNGSGSIIVIKTAVHVNQGDNLEQAKKDANSLATEFRKRVVSTLGK